jgi:YidC/Oxa1 family membrane protein insertase
MKLLWDTIFYQPIYNALVFITSEVTFGNIAFSVIILTILIKLILSPLAKKSIKSQILMKKMEPELKQIRKDFPNKEEQSKKTLELYKKYGTNPFSGCLVLIIQMPIIFALYYVFFNGTIIDPSKIYSFIKIPASMNTLFLGFIEMGSNHSIFLAVFAGITQFIQGYLSNPISPKTEILKQKDGTKDFQEQLSSSMQMNVKYILPIFIAFVAYKLSAAVALYWVTNNIFTIVQEWYIRRQLSKNI